MYLRTKLLLFGFLSAQLLFHSCANKGRDSEPEGVVAKAAKRNICKNIGDLIAKDSQCRKVNSEVLGEVNPTVAQLTELCKVSKDYKKLGLGGVNGKKFSEWLLEQLGSAAGIASPAIQSSAKILKKYADGIGLGVGVKGGVGLTTSAIGEFILHKNQVALFCAAQAGVVTDLTVSADLIAIKTLGCNTNQDYRGQFASVSIDGSFEWVGLPLEIGGSFNLGMDITAFLVEAGKFHKKYNNELVIALKTLGSKALDDNTLYFARDVTLALLYNTVGKFTNDTNLTTQIKTTIELSKGRLNDYKSLLVNEKKSYRLKDFLEQLSEILSKKSEYSVLSKYIQIFSASLTGCNSLTLYGGLSVSALPVSVTLGVSQYELLASADLLTFSEMNKAMRTLASYLSSNKKNCELNEQQLEVYVQVLKILRVIEQASELTPSVGSLQTCHRRLFDSATTIYQSLSNKNR